MNIRLPFLATVAFSLIPSLSFASSSPLCQFAEGFFGFTLDSLGRADGFVQHSRTIDTGSNMDWPAGSSSVQTEDVSKNFSCSRESLKYVIERTYSETDGKTTSLRYNVELKPTGTQSAFISAIGVKLDKDGNPTGKTWEGWGTNLTFDLNSLSWTELLDQDYGDALVVCPAKLLPEGKTKNDIEKCELLSGKSVRRRNGSYVFIETTATSRVTFKDGQSQELKTFDWGYDLKNVSSR